MLKPRFVIDRNPQGVFNKPEFLISRKWWIDGFTVVTRNALYSVFLAKF